MSRPDHQPSGPVKGENSRTLQESASRSRPSKTNCTPRRSDRLQFDSDDSEGADLSPERYWWRRKNELVREFCDDRPARAARPVSVRDDVKIREDAARERHEEGRYRAASWSDVLREFLSWYNGYRHAHLVFRDPEGERVRGQMPNSHQPRYGNIYYARLKALERQCVARFDDLHICMLTFTGSFRNDNGGWRCPADHLRDVVNSWRPDRGRGVYHTLRDALDRAGVDRWEYALVTEHHKSGYGHVHCAVFVDGAVSESDFHGVIDAHLRNCQIAGAEAHDYHAADPDTRPISVSSVDPDLDPDDYENSESIGNAASYVAEYIGAHGSELFDRSTDELQFRAVAWATGTQRVRFSTGANELINDDLDRDDADLDAENDSLGWAPGADAEAIEDAATDDDQDLGDLVDGDPGWSLEGIGRADEEGEELFPAEQSSVHWVRVEDASHLDPPSIQPFSRPQPSTSDASLVAYGDDD